MRPRFALLLLVPVLLAGQSVADLQKSFEKKVTEFTLPNGLHFILIERHEAPVISFHTYLNVGSVDDPGGETGLAHMFEHMAFKGTPTIGSKNWPAEKQAMAEVDQIYARLDAERAKGSRADAKKVAALEADLSGAMKKSESYVEENEYDRIVESNGGLDMNASTGEDSTNYFYSFPSNRIELWFLLESERFLHPVFREFYKERDVVREERRMRVESSSQGKLVEALLATAFAAHPYRNMPGGWASDINHFRRPDAERFYQEYYVPGDMTIGIAGDVNPVEARRLAEKYFGRLPARPLPLRYSTTEPPQEGEKRVAVSSPSQPFLIIAYKRPDQHSPDDAAIAVLDSLLSDGRTGLIYKDMVRDKQIALGAGSQPDFPGGKFPALFLFFVAPSSGHSIEENEREVYQLIEQVKTTKADAETLSRIKTNLRADVIRSLDSNSGLASELASSYANFGDWRKVFTELDDFNKVTAEDVQRVAKKYLVEDHRTVAYTFAPASPESAGREAAK